MVLPNAETCCYCCIWREAQFHLHWILWLNNHGSARGQLQQKNVTELCLGHKHGQHSMHLRITVAIGLNLQPSSSWTDIQTCQVFIGKIFPCPYLWQGQSCFRRYTCSTCRICVQVKIIYSGSLASSAQFYHYYKTIKEIDDLAIPAE